MTYKRGALLVIATFAFVLALLIYFHIVGAQSQVNSDMRASDQFAYLTFAQRAYDSSLHYTGKRNRMPLFPWIQAVFYSPELSDEAFFQQGKRVNTVISVICLVAVGLAFFARFSKALALYSLTVAAFLLYALKAPWFQAEILFYTLFWLSFALALECIRAPSWKKSVGVGALFAWAHFTKASALPGLLLYSVSFAVLLTRRLYKRDLRRADVWTVLAWATTPIVVFVILLFPYFSESKARYGQYLYNVNTTFYMWNDTWKQAKHNTYAAGDREGWPDLPAEEIPSLQNYLSTHSARHIVDRFRDGARAFFHAVCVKPEGEYRYGVCGHSVAALVIIVASVVAMLRQNRRAALATDLQAAFFATSFLGAYLLAALWYHPIALTPRILFSLILPLFWILGVVEGAACSHRRSLVIAGRVVKPAPAAFSLLTAIAAYQAIELAAFRAETIYGGG
ncbi:MAG: hypothetical protein OXG85_14315 [Chloroflexi bacterium]|nr:hypothetical protein [Chloroflexota bacterium]